MELWEPGELAPGVCHMMVQDVMVGHKPTLNECVAFAALCGQEGSMAVHKVKRVSLTSPQATTDRILQWPPFYM